MAVRTFTQQIQYFNKGLNKEATPLSVLPTEFMDGSVNVDLLPNGSLRRRRGLDFLGQSTSLAYLHTLRTGLTVDEVYQDSPRAITVSFTAPNGTEVERTIVAMNNKFYIYQHTEAGLLDADSPYQTIDYGSRAGSNQKYYPVKMVFSSNRLYFTGKHLQHGYLSVDVDNVSLTATYLDAYIRGANNTGAGSRVKNGTPSLWYECIQAHTSSASDEPGVGANWQRYWQRLDVATPAGVVAWGSGTGYVSQMVNIFDATETMDNTKSRSEVLAFFAGRMWLALGNVLYFTQVVRDESDVYGDLTRFHTFADPFDADDPDPVSDDGGQIIIQGAKKIYAAVEFNDSLFVATDVGVRQITGDAGIFTATAFAVYTNLTDPTKSAFPFVQTQDKLYVFGQGAVWASDTIDTTAGSKLKFNSVTDETLRTYYANIPEKSKASSYPLFNDSDKKIYYFFNEEVTDFDTSFNGLSNPGYATNCLVFDASTRPETIQQQQEEQIRPSTADTAVLYQFSDNADEEKPYIATAFVAPSVQSSQTTRNSVFIIPMRRSVSGANTTIEFSFGKICNSCIYDWDSVEDYKVDVPAYILFGTQNGGDLGRKKHPTYILLVFKKVTDGSAKLRTATQFASNNTSKKWGDAFQVYFPDRYTTYVDEDIDDGHNYTYYKHRSRGRGNVWQYILESEEGKDFHLIGWANSFHGNTQ